jgi:tetratricopeptide (TPR) repeat protein
MNYCLSIFGCVDPGMERVPFIDVEDENELYPHVPLPQPGRLQDIMEAKTKGNEAFQKGDDKTAIQEYTKGISLFVGPSEEKQVDGVDDSPLILLTMLLSNRSAAYINCCEYEKALYDSRGIIIYRPNWVKGHFRRGCAYFGLRKFDKALEAFQTASHHVKYTHAGPVKWYPPL